MAGKRRRKKRRHLIGAFTALILLFLFVPFLSFALQKDLLPPALVPAARHVLNIFDPDALRQTSPLPGASRLPADLSGYLLVDFLDVGQADCTLIRQGEHAMLFDCGEAEEGMVTEYLKGEGVTELQIVCLSHTDADHISAFASLSGTCKVGRVLMSPYAQAKDTAAYDSVSRAIALRQIPFEAPAAGSVYPLGDAQVQVLGPVAEDPEILNNNCLAVRVVYGDTAVLLCADAQSEEEAALCAGDLPLRSQLLHVNHHGSNSSSTERFLARTAPDYAVISCGADNDYGHPGEYALSRLRACGAQILRTDQLGSIRFLSDGGSFAWYAGEAAA